MLTRVLINGAHGKMGTLACEIIRSHPDFELVGTLTRQDNLREKLSQTSAQIAIDLTCADSVYENTLIIVECGVHPVIGTSGLLEDQIKTLKQKCETLKLGGIIVPNFSLSAVLMMRFATEAARNLSEIEIIEAHHQNKLDSPSGTAIKTAELIANAKSKPNKDLPLREIISGARGGKHQGIPIHSLRLPGILAYQQVIFGNEGETLTITHNTIDRTCFKPGIILACQGVQKLDSLYYGLEHLID